MQLVKQAHSFQDRSKKAYKTPVLSNFGKISKVTAGGSYGNAEGGWWDKQPENPEWIPPGQRNRMRS